MNDTPENGTLRINIVMIASVAAVLGIMGSLFLFWNSREKQLWILSEDYQHQDREIALLQSQHLEHLSTLQSIRARQETMEKIVTTNTARITDLERDLKELKGTYFQHEKEDLQKFKSIAPP